jgi:hypothetical protein
MSEPQILAVNLARMEAVTDDGRVIPITELAGDHAAVAYGGPGEWFSIDLAAFTEKPQ